MTERKTFSRAGTARALVLLASGLAVGGSVLLCLLALVLANRLVLPTAVFAAFALLSAVIATLLAIRARSLRGVIGFGCGTLLAGLVIGLAVVLSLIATTMANSP